MRRGLTADGVPWLVMTAGLAGLAGLASADPLETSGFLGVDYFGSRTGLGDSMQPEQIPQTSPMLGAHLTWVALPRLAPRVDLAAEGELAITPTFTGYGFQSHRPSYFTPVFGWRFGVLARVRALPWLRPHLVVGVGGETIASESPYVAKETDPMLYWGPGATFPFLDRWQVRVDLRHGLVPARGGGTTSTFEGQLGIGMTFGLPRKASAPHAAVVEEPVGKDVDSDGDGIPDRLDACPKEAESVNGIDDDDGCPEPDPDGDGIIGEADKCPDQAEDFDHFQDEDGCPELDNDNDGIPDARDQCPSQPEMFNGIDDDDGCPDSVPPAIAAALAGTTAVRFDAGKMRITDAAKKALQRTLDVLRDKPNLKVVVTGHPDKTGGDELAKKRAEAVKWYLVEQGVAQDQVMTTVGEPGSARAPMIEITLAISVPAR